MLGFSKKGDSKATSSGGNTALKGAAMEGILKRKNRHGEWKERYCKFTSSQFVAYKTSKGKATTEMKECYNLKEIVTAELNAKGQLLVTLLNGDQSLFKGDHIPAWKDAILSLSEEANEMHQETIAQAAGSSNAVSISGYLMKQSHNKYQGYQERYMRLEGTQLKYYKKEGDQEQGAINIVSANFIRPFSDDDACKIFEIADQEDRVYAFQARSHTEMVRWIQTLNTVRNAAMDKAEEEKAAKLEAETPERIRFFDNEGEDAFQAIYREQLMDMYPDPAKEAMTIKTHLQYATEVVQYLKDLIPELQAVGNRPARYDILAVAMTETNAILSNRLNFFVEPTFDDGTGDAGNQYLHDVLETANLGELHALIQWLSKYQSTLRGIRCPVHSPGTAAVTSQARLSTTHVNPKQCDVFQYLQRICKLYVYGGSSGAKGGAAEHLADHCHKVWQSVESNPEEMLQRHNNGTFFTEAPIQMWMAINQHIALATSTNSPILHVMIAEKVVTSLMGIFEHIIQYIQTLDTSSRPSLREVELEYVSALANDTALHIEDVIELIEHFTIPEIREKIDEIFDPLTTTLFQCGQTCLKRLAKLVMADVQSLLDQVFEEEWMEGSPMRVATATISDYMRDFQEFLVPFWADKFVMTILEEVIVSYTRTLLFRKDKKKSVTTTVTTTDPGAAGGGGGSVGGMFSSFFQKTKQTITQTITTQVPTHVPVDAESLGRLAQDVNILNAFFSQKAGQELATEFLQLINEVSLLLFVDVPSIIQHIAVRVSEYPAAAHAIRDVAIAVMKLRYEDFTRADMDYVSQQVQGVLQSAPEDAARQEAEGIVEGRLGLLYNDVVPKDPSATLAKGGAGAMTLTQRMRIMANIPLFGAAARTIIGDEDDDGDGTGGGGAGGEDESGRPAATSVNTPSGAGDRLLRDVLDVLNEQEPDSLEQDNEYAREQARQEAEEAARKAKLLYYDGYLEKKSPAHNLWQRRFYKLVTREVDSLDKPFVYSLLWFKKEGGSLIKSLEVDKIASMAVLQTARAMAFVLPPKAQLMLMSEATASGLAKCAIPVVECDHEENKNDAKGGGAPSVVKQEYYTLLITQADGKEHVLRGLKVDRVMKWINTLAQAGGFAYDSVSRTWTRAAFENFKRLEAEGRLPVPEPPPSMHSPTAAGRRRTSSSSSMVDDARHSSASASSTSAANTPTAAAALTLPSAAAAAVNPKSAASGGGGGGGSGGGGGGVSQRQVLQSLLEHDDDAGTASSAAAAARGGARDRLRSRSSVSVGDSHSGAPSRSTTQDEYDDASATTPRARDSSHDESVAVATKLRRQSQQLGVHSLPEERLAQLAQQTQDDASSSSVPPPPPPSAASSSPRTPPPRKTTAPLTPRDDDGGVLLHEDTAATTRTSLSSAGGGGGSANRSRLNSETTNPIFAQPSPTAASVKRGSVSTENPLAQSSPLQTRPSLSSASKSVRKTAPPPPPPPPADASPPPPPAPPAGDDADDRDSLFYDRETQAWPSSANTSFALDSQSNDADASSSSGGSPRAGAGGGKSAATHRASVAKRAAQNRARQQQQQQQQQQAAQPSQPAAVVPVSIAAAGGSGSSSKAATTTTTKPTTTTTTAAVDRDDDFDRSSVMTVDLDAGPAPKATVAGGSRNMQAFEVQEQSNAKHNDSERLLGDQKKPAGCPCVIS